MPDPITGIMGGSAVLSYVGSKKATKAQTKGITKGMEAEERIAAKNLSFQREMADEQRADFAPWREIGEKALNSIWEGVNSGGFDVGKINLEDDPGYRVRMQEGIDALDASASSRGRLLSGAQNKALTQYGQEQGSKEYGNAYARQLNEKNRNYNMLSSLSQGGQSSAAGQAQASSQLASTGGNIMAQQGRSQNIGYNNIGNARASGYQDQSQIINQAAQNWLTHKG
tara:strand:- start:562 stop:1242 length:681 start_codon:yes stop_codon:yes gene_type:complete